MSKEEQFLNICFLAHLSKNSLVENKGIPPFTKAILLFGMGIKHLELIAYQENEF